MQVYGLTGGIASGKTEAARRFAARGIPVIDADQAGHEAIAPGGAAEAAVLAAFGPDVCAHGRIDRDRLGALVFRDAGARARLNAIVHPVIIESVSRRCAQLADDGAENVIVEAALLGEHGEKAPWLAGLILVLSPTTVRVQRLVASRGLSEEEAWRRITAQTPPESKRSIADWVIENDGDIAALYAQVDAVAEVIHGAV